MQVLIRPPFETMLLSAVHLKEDLFSIFVSARSFSVLTLYNILVILSARVLLITAVGERLIPLESLCGMLLSNTLFVSIYSKLVFPA